MNIEDKTLRIIAHLDVKGPNLVKGIHLEGLRVLGDPAVFSEYYYNNGIDEIIYKDTVASLYSRDNLLEIIKKTSEKTFVPITVGGGIRSLEDIQNVLSNGADRVLINSEAIKNPDIINNAVNKYGSSTIIAGIEAGLKKDVYYSYYNFGREFSGKEVLNWSLELQQRGVGEILITSIDNDGTGNGFQIDLIKKLKEKLSIPIIAHGGAESANDILNLKKNVDIDAVALASTLHYNFLKENNVPFNKNNVEGNTNFLEKKKKFKNFGTESISDIKNFLLKNNVNVRI
jgi:cyclase